MKIKLIVLVALGLAQWSHGANNAPEQVHIALGASETEMVVTWATLHHINDEPQVQFGESESDLKHTVKAEVTHFTDGAHLYTYRALLTGLKAHGQYYYRVGSKGSSWSKVFQFRTFPSGQNWNPTFAIYGDLGYQNEESLPFLSKEVEKNVYDAIFHIGDLAYDLYERHGEQGNDFMRSIEKVAARVPYMTCPGNHERHGNFSHYDARFSMIGDRDKPNQHAPLSHRINNHFHSMDIGPAHIIMFSTEFYYYTQYGWDQIRRQYEWLEEDLKRANQPNNRLVRPWLIVMGHRPLYCLKIGDNESCKHDTFERPKIRQGIHWHNDESTPLKYGLEDLFFKYNVDIQFYGHEHFYGRMLPIYNYTVMGGSRSSPYDNPHAPIHITTGSAGNRERHPPFLNPLKSWVADHHFDYGYTRLVFKGRDHITLEQTSDDKGGVVLDKIDILKTPIQPVPHFIP